MSQPRKPRLPEELLRELGEAGANWSIERRTRHWMLRIGGRAVAVIPTEWRDDRRRGANMMACVRRALRGDVA